MRLTNTIRDAFIRAAMNDVPSVDYVEEVRKVLTDDTIAGLPQAIKDIAKDPVLSGFLHSTYGGFNTRMCSVSYIANRHQEHRLSMTAQKTVDELIAKHKAQTEQRNTLNGKLRIAAYGCNTRKALVELLPEFEKYLPADEAKAITQNLPAVANVLSDFVKAGWPKNQPKMPKVTP